MCVCVCTGHYNVCSRACEQAMSACCAFLARAAKPCCDGLDMLMMILRATMGVGDVPHAAAASCTCICLDGLRLLHFELCCHIINGCIELSNLLNQVLQQQVTHGATSVLSVYGAKLCEYAYTICPAGALRWRCTHACTYVLPM